MRRFLPLFLFGALSLAVPAQNLQLHYDLGKSLYGDLSPRQDVTTTIEMYKPDKWGSTYFFDDIDYKSDGVMGSYWEVSREFTLTANRQWAAHVEYNGGVTSGETPDQYYANRFQHALLAGGAWNWHDAAFRRTFSLQVLYKYYFASRHLGAHAFSGFQLTEVWGVTFGHGLCTFSGFCDVWYHPDVNGRLILLSEPQFWFNFNSFKGWEDIHLSLGTECEVSNNFVYNERGRNNKFFAIPTLAAKWTF